jgi:long-chain acyl-CoA synthetase
VGVNVGQLLRQAALRWPERAGVIDLGHAGGARRELRFAELDRAARSLAAALAARGIAPGDHVALIGENSAEFVAGWFAVAYAGCAVVPVPVLSSAAELRFRVEHARCRALLFDAARASLVREALARPAGGTGVLQIELALETAPGTTPLAEPVDTSASAGAMILYTSGTAGDAKAAVISHASLALHTAGLVHHALALGENDRVLGILPLTHSYGCRMVMLASAFAGATAVLVPRFDAARALELLRAEAITWLPGVPTMFAAFAARPAIAKLPSLRWCLSAGAPLADETARRAEQRLGVEVRQGYGMTEATFSAMNAPPDERVLGSVGRPVWGVRVRVVDAQGDDVPLGASGEVIVRGHNAMNGYLGELKAPAATERDGFVHSGDVGRFDAAGRLYIVDRIKDLIIRGGFNIHPSEVEAALAAHADVLDVAVVGRPDDYYGEEVVALVIKRPESALDAAALIAFGRTKLARNKLPREVGFLEAFPLGPSGKVQKRVLREWLRAGRVTLESG